MARPEGNPVGEKTVVSEQDFLSKVHEVHREMVQGILSGLRQVKIEGRSLEEVVDEMEQIYARYGGKTVWDSEQLERYLSWWEETSPSAEDGLKVQFFRNRLIRIPSFF